MKLHHICGKRYHPHSLLALLGFGDRNPACFKALALP